MVAAFAAVGVPEIVPLEVFKLKPADKAGEILNEVAALPEYVAVLSDIATFVQ